MTAEVRSCAELYEGPEDGSTRKQKAPGFSRNLQPGIRLTAAERSGTQLVGTWGTLPLNAPAGLLTGTEQHNPGRPQDAGTGNR